MTTIKPAPIRAFKSKREADGHATNDSLRLKSSKSATDIPSLSRTSSFLSFAGFDQLKSSALFGIFEREGLDTEPGTPEVQKHYDFNLTNPPAPPDPHAELSSYILGATKLLGVAGVSFAFIILFNQIPSNNKFCSISPSQSFNPLVYVLMATTIAVISPLLDDKLKSFIPTKNKISPPNDKSASVNAITTSTSPAEHDRTKDWSFNVLVRYFAGFLGLAYAGTKLDFSQSSQFNLCVAAISLAVLLILDRTTRGLVVSISLASLASTALIVIRGTPAKDIVGVATLVWLNVCVYGTLGKVLRIWGR